MEFVASLQAAKGNRHVHSQIIFITATETGFYLNWVECHATYDGSHKVSHMKNEHEREQLILGGKTWRSRNNSDFLSFS